ncbi:MAG: S41 family peptidase [Telluria sp.]
MNKKFYRTMLAVLLSVQGALASAADVAPQCLADLDDLAAYMPINDAGASAELADHGRAIEQAWQSARAAAQQAGDDNACELALRSYLRAWRPGHLSLMSNASVTSLSATVDARTDPRAPQLKVLDQHTVLLSLRTFDGRYQSAMQALLKQHRRTLETHRQWIIDVRDNNGGSDSTYMPLLPWLLDGEYVQHRIEWLATPANLRAQADVCKLLGDSEKCMQAQAPVIKALEGAAPGTWVMIGERVEYRRPEGREPRQPTRVAVLVDRACASSCEQFLLEARSGSHVKLLGRPSRGSLDYSNLRPHQLPSGKRTVMYATSRSLRLPAMGIDGVGVQPDILLPQPADSAAEVMQVQRWLAGGSLRPD